MQCAPLSIYSERSDDLRKSCYGAHCAPYTSPNAQCPMPHSLHPTPYTLHPSP
ncbi:MAG: hypothetical protein F6J93_04800 [Oscillatoria sp. SIO1A7]|nr:hypothetical protein [Oscillatoria sp. SIO1A7]